MAGLLQPSETRTVCCPRLSGFVAKMYSQETVFHIHHLEPLTHCLGENERYDGNGLNCQMEVVRITQMEIVRIAKKGNSSTISLTVELFPFFAMRTISHF